MKNTDDAEIKRDAKIIAEATVKMIKLSKSYYVLLEKGLYKKLGIKEGSEGSVIFLESLKNDGEIILRRGIRSDTIVFDANRRFKSSPKR